MNIKEFSDHFGGQDHYQYSDHWLVYFLVDRGGEIVYVGKSSSIGLGKRLKAHKLKGKEFCSYFVQVGPKTENEAFRLEGAFISFLRPKYNKANLRILAEEIEYLSKWMEQPKENFHMSKIETVGWKSRYGSVVYSILLGLMVAPFFYGYAKGLEPNVALLNIGFLSWMVIAIYLMINALRYTKFETKFTVPNDTQK